MNPNSSASPAAEVWNRLAGMYGADTLARKYGAAIPAEWTAMLSKLSTYQVQRGVRMLAYSGKPHVPSLPEFVKLCRDAEHDRPVMTQPALAAPEQSGDDWDASANIHLLGYVLRKGKERKYFDAAATQILVAFKNAWARDMREGNVDTETGEVSKPEVPEQKAAWADCMQRAEATIAQEIAA